MKRGTIKRKATKRSKEGAAAYERFKRRWAGRPCWGCGARWRAFHRHHIVGRDGIAGADDERDLAHLCDMCHAVHHDNGIQTWHGETVKVRLTKDDVLRLKRDRDPEYWDLAFLRELAGRRDLGDGME